MAALMAAACGGNPGQSNVDLGIGDAVDGGGTVPDGSDAGNLPDAQPPTDVPPVDVNLPFTPASVDTMAPMNVRVGDMITVTCVLVDASGETNAPPPGLVPDIRVEPASSVMMMGGNLIAIRTGQVEIACAFPTLSLVDTSPALVQIAAGPPASVTTAVDTTTVTAGGTATAACLVYDAYGNLVTDVQPTVTVTPSDTGNTTDGNTTTFTHTGRYTVACTLEGAASTGVGVEVDPALPAQLVLGKSPDEAVYFVGQNVEVTHTVLDRYGNTVPNAQVIKTSANVTGSGPTNQIGFDRFSYGGDGLYRVTGTVSGPTDGNVVLSGTVDILVDSNGPDIRCDSPGDGTVVVLSPGAPVTFHGSVSDVNGLAAGGVMVNGNPVNVAGDGSFQLDVTTTYGINFIDLVATDANGQQNSRTCAFLVADRFVNEGALLDNSVMLRLAQSAVDDNSRAGAINSLDDILSIVLNSPGLASTLDSALRNANPLKANSCDQQVCVFGACACVLSSEIDYNSSSLPGPNTSSLTLVQGGLAASVRFNAPVINLRVQGHAAGIPFNTTGDVDIDFIQVNVTFDLGVDGNGRPNISVRPNTISVSVGNITTHFSGIDGFIINLAVAIANGTIRNIVANTLQSFVTNNFNSVLDGLVSGLDISSLGTSFNVPKLDGSGNITLNFGLGFSSIGANSARALFGIGTRFTAATSQTRDPHQAPLPPFDTFVDPDAAGRPVAIAVHVGVFQQALQALWRAGLFDGDLGAIAGGGEGASAVLSTGLPPVVYVKSGTTVGLDLGAINLVLNYPGVIDNLAVTLGARATTTVTLNGDDLTFSGITIDQLFFSTGAVSLDQATRNTLESFFQRLLQSAIGSALNNALPALPIPSFPIPGSLGQFGLPVGGQLGITGATLNAIDPHFILRGNFGVR
jgi:hypothetical protein